MFAKPNVLCLAQLLALGAASAGIPEAAADPKPNVVVIFCDDLGYGDLGCYGHPTIATTNLDRMASEGMKLTSFYVAASVCTPSRAGLMTGRLPIRSGMCGKRRVLFPDSAGGLPAEEVTIAEVLKTQGYATAMVGKWHLGHLPQYLPTTQGFDSYFGIPYSNDMDRKNAPGEARWKSYRVPLLRDTKEIERPVDQTTITKRYTEEAVKFINEKKDKPFFLYMAHTMPHIPLFASDEFKGTSRRGLYGDVVEEIDWSVGEVLKAIKENGIDEKTLVVFTSDNGPWLIFKNDGGSAGLLKDGKGCTFEGGMREPCLIRWPGTIPAGKTSAEMASTLDLLPTFAALSGAELPEVKLDGYDLTGMLTKGEKSPRDEMFYYRNDQLFAVRKGKFKAHYITQGAYGPPKRTEHETPLLYDLDVDPGERFEIGKGNPEVLKEIDELAKQHQAELKKGEPQLEKRIGK